MNINFEEKRKKLDELKRKRLKKEEDQNKANIGIGEQNYK